MFAAFIPLCFSIIFVSLTFTKLAHLYIYASAVSPGPFALYLPSLLLPDVFVICLSRLALQREKGVIALSACTLGCIFSLILLCGASSQLGFIYKTGSEIQWTDAVGYAADKDGMKVLLSGSAAVLAAALGIIAIAWIIKSYIYRAVGVLLMYIGAPIVYVWQLIKSYRGATRRKQRNRTSDGIDPGHASDSDFYSDDEYDTQEAMGLVNAEGGEWKHSYGRSKPGVRHLVLRIAFAVVLVFLGLTTIFRPQIPYSMMATTLPFAMMEMFMTSTDMCAERSRLHQNRWPFPKLIDEKTWEKPHKHLNGWAPSPDSELAKSYKESIPEWLPKPIPLGFSKWHDKNATEEPGHLGFSCPGVEDGNAFYNPVNDPMKISNLDTDILDIVQEALNNKTVKIKHVALIMMESLREELFPLQQGSEMHKLIMQSYDQGEDDDANSRLSGLSPNAEKITGKPGNFKRKDGSEFHSPTPEWNDTAKPGFGGINVVGGFTPASLSMKSLAAMHCGVWPMPVDMFEESQSTCYQPCIPNILELFNQLKEGKPTGDFLEQPWRPVLFQSITDGYDRQQEFDEKAGFKQVVTKKTLETDADDKTTLEEINYFGYAETTLRSHIEDYIKSSKKNGTRMFLSHITSTTHHPWALPNGHETIEYLRTRGGMRWHNDFNKYLNTVRFTDAWLGEFMQMFEDFGIANETLVVFVGDHGQAFKEDTSKTGTYENGHVSNFRVPITFRHPNIPRVQYHANATSLSILPTILDLLINTGSLNKKDTAAASDIIQDYEGQSLIRPYKRSHNGRRAWNFGIVNAGARILSVTSADAPWRLVIPLDRRSEYRFTDLKNDPIELQPTSKWSIQSLTAAVKDQYGKEASEWVTEAEAVSRWWAVERKRLWGYTGKK